MSACECEGPHLAISLLQLLHCDGEDGMGATGVLIHECCPYTPVLLTNLQSAINEPVTAQLLSSMTASSLSSLTMQSLCAPSVTALISTGGLLSLGWMLPVFCADTHEEAWHYMAYVACF